MGIVITKDKKVLLLKNDEEMWVLPKGHNELGESYVETAIREVREETGVNLKEQDLLKEIDEYKYYSNKEQAMKIIKVMLFEIDKKQSIVTEEEFLDGIWVDENKALEMIYHEDAKEALKKSILFVNK